MSFDIGDCDDSYMYDSFEEQADRMSNSELKHQLRKKHDNPKKNNALIKIALARILDQFPIKLEMKSHEDGGDW